MKDKAGAGQSQDTSAYVGIGSNIEPERYIPQAVRLLREQFGELVVSPMYSCPAVGFNGPEFVNLVVRLDTCQTLDRVLSALRQIEAACGRVRGEQTSSRTMDLDLLLFGNAVVDEGKLNLPRDDILRYAFVLKPLADIAGDQRHPVNGRRYSALWTEFDDSSQSLKVITLG